MKLLHLPNGLRLAWMHTPESRVEYFGVSVDVGSRDESPRHHGLAHFVEHTIFKGTERHRSSYIINRMESVGGELNAYTAKEETVVYTVAPAGNLRRSADLVADLISGSTFPEAEIDREREVVIDEIQSYLDSPADAVVDDFEDLAYRGSGPGHNILGDPDSVRAIGPEVCRDYLRRFYVPENMVLFYSGPLTAAKVEQTAARTFGHLHHPMPARRREAPPEVPRFDIVRDPGLHQAHTLMGARIPGACSPERHVMSLLANILGGPGMNSLLNVELREKRGLVYSVDASASLLSDCGLMQIYFGCDSGDVELCRRRVAAIITRVADGLITPRRLEQAKRQYLGQLSVASEHSESRALSLGRCVTLYGKMPSMEHTAGAIRDITARQLADAAALLLPDRLSRLTLT